jgi:hypothetical protein
MVIPTELIEAALLEPKTEQINSTNDEATNIIATNNNQNQLTPDFQILGTFGKDQISLVNWNNTCFITIPGRYTKNQTNSLAIWMPRAPNGLYIFSYVVHTIKAIEFFILINQNKNVTYLQSKSYIFLNNELYPLTIISINNEKQPVYIYAQ